jgi:hypothetical protein
LCVIRSDPVACGRSLKCVERTVFASSNVSKRILVVKRIGVSKEVCRKKQLLEPLITDLQLEDQC